MGKSMMSFPCRFCGQMRQISSTEELTQPQGEEQATLECSCIRAIEYKKEKKRKENAIKNVDALFGSEAPEGKALSENTVQLLKTGIEEIYSGELAKITLNVRGGVKATLSQNSKGENKVEREEKRRQQLTE